jgi:hypothetical protein
VPYTDSWNVSLQRAITKDTVFEVRYQGNRGWGAWTLENWNSTNLYETGWLNGEFEKAQANLRANVLAGRGGTMKYFGEGTGHVAAADHAGALERVEGCEQSGGLRRQCLDELDVYGRAG